MELRVALSPEAPPLWPAVAELLGRHGFPVQMRMIDGELAFPDETPPAAWRELRFGTPAGMVTLRREADGVALVTWGNADDALRRAWHALAWACAEVTGGRVATPQGAVGAAEFRSVADLPAGLRG
jgi:hypothetical protein